MSATSTDIDGLREAYRQARGNIFNISDEFERNVGFAALRLEAMHAYRELVTTSSGLSDDDIAPLKEYVANLKGGEKIESSIDALDNQVQSFASKVVRDLWALLTTGTAVGVLAVIANVVLIAAIAAESFGAVLFGAVITGGSAAVFVLRGGEAAGRALLDAWDSSWGWASRLGSPADTALTEARKVQAGVLQRAAGGGLAMQRFTDRVRTRAQMIMGIAWTAVALALILVAVGFAQAARDWGDKNRTLTDPTRTLTSPSGGGTLP